MRVLLLALLCLAGLSSATAGSRFIPWKTSSSVPTVPGLPGLKDTRFYWDAQTLNADYLGASVPPVYQLAGIPDSGGLPVLGTNPYDSQTWAVVNGSWDKWDWWVDTDTDVWGSPLGKQWMRIRYMPETAFTAAMLLFQANVKTRDSGNPLNGNSGVRLDTTTSSSNPAITGTSAIATIPGTVSAGTELELILTKNNTLTNANAAITEVVYVRRAGYDTVSAYSVGTTSTPDGNYYHNMQPGHDRITAGAYYFRGFYFGRNYDYDMPCDMWQDFNVASLTQANLEASDHNNGGVWAETGTTSRFSLVDEAPTHPSTINLYTPTGKVIRNDLTVTTAGALGYTFTSTSAEQQFGMWFRASSGIADGTTAIVAYATSPTNQTTSTAAVRVGNTGGQYHLALVGATTSSTINISANTWYWVTWTGRQNATQTLWVYNTSGTEVSGSGVTCTGSTRGVGSLRVGHNGGYTAQSSGVYVDVAHLCYRYKTAARLLPWEVTP